MASLADLATLSALVSFGGVSPRVASVPALLLGNIVMFFAQKHFAFRSRGRARGEAARFILVQLGGFALNAALYDAGACSYRERSALLEARRARRVLPA